MTSTVNCVTILLLVSALVRVDGKRGERQRKKCKRRRCEAEVPDTVRRWNVSSLAADHVAACPGEYSFEEGDALQLTSPRYPRRYPNKHDCAWRLRASGCQFAVACADLYTKPSCPGPTWRPLTRCEGDYLRFYSDNLQTEVSTVQYAVKYSIKYGILPPLRFYSENLQTEESCDGRSYSCDYQRRFLNRLKFLSLLFPAFPLQTFFRCCTNSNVTQDGGPAVTMDQRFCYKQNVNFTFGFSDILNVQFKTDRNHKARGFNCTVTCEGFDFSALFARIPFSNDEAEAVEDEDYEDDYDDDEEYEDEDYNDDYALEDEEGVESN